MVTFAFYLLMVGYTGFPIVWNGFKWNLDAFVQEHGYMPARVCTVQGEARMRTCVGAHACSFVLFAVRPFLRPLVKFFSRSSVRGFVRSLFRSCFPSGMHSRLRACPGVEGSCEIESMRRLTGYKEIPST